jgi:hypothetical protein
MSFVITSLLFAPIDDQAFNNVAYCNSDIVLWAIEDNGPVDVFCPAVTDIACAYNNVDQINGTNNHDGRIHLQDPDYDRASTLYKQISTIFIFFTYVLSDVLLSGWFASV